jgi:hypothetical protein
MRALIEVCFALKHKLVRVLMVTPFTSIFEQNRDLGRAANRHHQCSTDGKAH